MAEKMDKDGISLLPSAKTAKKRGGESGCNCSRRREYLWEEGREGNPLSTHVPSLKTLIIKFQRREEGRIIISICGRLKHPKKNGPRSEAASPDENGDIFIIAH